MTNLVSTDDKDMRRTARAVAAYFSGKDQSPSDKAGAEAFLSVLPKEQVDKLKSIARRTEDSITRAARGDIINPDVAAFEQEQKMARIELVRAVRGLAEAIPNAKEKVLSFGDTTPATPTAPKFPDIRSKFAPTELAVQQQQAFLKLLNFDIGKHGLDGIAGKGSDTQKALDEFARKNGIDPANTAKVNQALYTAAQSTANKPSLEAIQKRVDAGKVSPEDVKILQWVLHGVDTKMPLSLKDDKMDGIAGPETKTLLKVTIDDKPDDLVIKRLRDKFRPAVETPSAPDLRVSPKDPSLEKFYESLTPAQREMQRKIAELGGSQPQGEVLGILAELADEYYRSKRVQGDIYDGGFPKGGKKGMMEFKYEPSEEVRRLTEEFDKSLTPAQRALREKYEESQKEKGQEIRLKRDKEIYVGPDLREYTDPARPNKYIKEPTEFEKFIRKEMPVLDDDLIGGRLKVEGIDLGGSFGKAGRGNVSSLTGPEAVAATFGEDMAMRRERLQPNPGNPALGAPKN